MPRVLLLDDDHDFMDSLSRVLVTYGHEAVGAQSIEDAYRLAKNQNFDVLLLDIMMPPSDQMDPREVSHGRETGREVAEHIREIDHSLPIVVLSVVTDPVLIETFEVLGRVSFMKKPQEMVDISSELDRMARTPNQGVTDCR